ncbi:MAG: hypothetical protein EXR28_15400 [Betaproteobacteria bacterium]|nr:hypothetical protein [Betaproteobacteria bacterium]
MNKFILAASLISLFAATLPAQAQPEPAKGVPASRAQLESLLTPQEREQFRDKARAAKTPEERSEIQKQMRATVEQRAKEKGITLPQGRPGQREGRRDSDSGRAALLTPEERTQYRDKARAAKTPEERAEIRKQMRATMEQRAKEKGVTPPRGPEGRPGSDKEGRRPQLLTQDERLQYRDKMRAAKTPDERAVLRKQMRELTEQRAKEKGVTLRERRAPAESPKAPAAKN